MRLSWGCDNFPLSVICRGGLISGWNLPMCVCLSELFVYVYMYVCLIYVFNFCSFCQNKHNKTWCSVSNTTYPLYLIPFPYFLFLSTVIFKKLRFLCLFLLCQAKEQSTPSPRPKIGVRQLNSFHSNV